ncbi:hypothetical protein Dda_4621 [Drechslerella dactyloides]|uniref:NADH dehydrogenase [ubiquinone] 1 beta subcomplex subunit 9 n=1 Tax=Drechslerella dactyloides TaxID=74499 RepID=A0AAD6NJJ1_DREDA|nr:hypothetical protein Dda_4621 [Drechslerella dactyloides]
MSTPTRIVPSLYRQALKLSLNWTVRRDVWRPQALAIRQLFEANRDVREPKLLKVATTDSPPAALIAETEAQLDKWKHPDPYLPPLAPGGTPISRSDTFATTVWMLI